MEYYAGIDVGGTKIYGVIIDKKGTILSRAKVKTGGKGSFEKIFEKIKECINKACTKAEITPEELNTMGMAVPSPVDIEKGLLLHAPNLGWQNIEIARILYNEYKKPVFIDNDVNMGVFGEYSFGIAHKFNHIYGMFVGTGIGGGYISNGTIFRGKNNTAGEVGHMIIKMKGPECNCGNRGCLEAIGGKVGIIKYIAKHVDNGGQTKLDELAPNWRKTIGSSKLKACYEMGDEIVVKAVHRSARAVGIAAANLVNAIGIEAIILGGGVIEELGDVMIPQVEGAMHECSIGGGAKGVEVIKSHLGDDAVALGAGWFAALEENKDLLLRF